MTIKMNIDFTKIYETYSDDKLDELWNFIAKKLYSKVKRLMNQSKDVNGKAYKPYSKSYLKQRLKEGLSSKVNLQWDSDMFNSISFESKKDGFYIFLTDSKSNEKAIRIMNTSRKFFEWGSELEKDMNRILKIWWNQNMQ